MNKPISAAEFEQLGHLLIDQLARFLEKLEEDLPLTRAEGVDEIQKALGGGALPMEGRPPETILRETLQLLIDHSLYNGHPGFMGYVTSSALPIGALADLIAATLNPNVGAFRLAPMATEMERQSVRWIAEFIGYPATCGGLFVSGGNMANFVGFLAARRAKGEEGIQKKGLKNGVRQLLVYVSQVTHTWVQKAADLFGLGTEAIRWIPTNEEGQMDIQQLEATIIKDKQAGHRPFLVVGTAGTVSFGVVDPIRQLSALCKEHDLWLHIDGAYGAPVAGLNSAPEDLKALGLADSLAIDPHKWFYAALEVGCVLVKDPKHLLQTFSYHPDYYEFSTENMELDYYEYGPQNSRGFRALKVWLSFQLLGKKGFVDLIGKDLLLSQVLFRKVGEHPELVAHSNQLSITTFSYVPPHLQGQETQHLPWLNELNKAIVHEIYLSGKAFISNAYAGERYLLRACLVNFRTREEDLDRLLELVVASGKKLSKTLS